MTADDTEFWDLHATMDVDHADWAVEGLAEITDDVEEVGAAARRAAEQWWLFLDEREALRMSV